MVANLGKLKLEVVNAGDDEEKTCSYFRQSKKAIDPSVDFLNENQIAVVMNSLNAKIKLLGQRRFC